MLPIALSSPRSRVSSIEKCREALQAQIQRIHSEDLQDEAMDLLAAVEGIERMKAAPDANAINKLKVVALHSFRKLAEATHGSYPLPKRGKLAEAVYFTQDDADAALNIEDLKNQLSITSRRGRRSLGLPTIRRARADDRDANPVVASVMRRIVYAISGACRSAF